MSGNTEVTICNLVNNDVMWHIARQEHGYIDRVEHGSALDTTIHENGNRLTRQIVCD